MPLFPVVASGAASAQFPGLAADYLNAFMKKEYGSIPVRARVKAAMIGFAERREAAKTVQRKKLEYGRARRKAEREAQANSSPRAIPGE